jgi:hypothetical protein
MGGVSMYFIGTGHDRSETVDSKGAKAQLFPWFHDNLDEGVVNREKFLFDGPGSGGLTNSKVNFWKKYRGVALGEGWKKNRDRAIQALSEYGGSRICVNLVGHSRGAVTCHMLAHAIKREYKGMIVRIFAVDPVPGGETDFGAQAEIIPSNVSEYVQILMENDSSMGFGVMGPKRLHFESSKTQRRKYCAAGCASGGICRSLAQIPKKWEQANSLITRRYWPSEKGRTRLARSCGKCGRSGRFNVTDLTWSSDCIAYCQQCQ